MKYLEEKASISINGVSLTISKVLKNIILNIIPDTLKLTNLKNLKVNDVVNIELDIFAKYITNIQNNMSNNIFSNISSIINDAKKGKMFILVDDKDRENEGDLIIPGSKCNSQSINFMAKHGRGLICLALTKQQIEKLKLPLMSRTNKSRMQTAFTISIEAKKGISTGISAYDRAKTISVAINKKAKKNDIVSPGHVFPLVARQGGVLERAGH